jgi:SAM-dependent methyltransferase
LRKYSPDGTVDLVYTNGVFHHIPEPDRAAAVAYIHKCLRPEGIFALWENNPLNLGTRYVMSQCSFDHDAIPIRVGVAKGLLADCFEIIAVNYLFFFPRFLSILRPLESYLTRVPLGAQYQILCRRT